MNRYKEHELTLILRMLARKGTYNIFIHIRDYSCISYNDILTFAMNKHLFKSRATVTTIVNGLTDCGLLDKEVVHTRPIGTRYSVNEKGIKMIKCLDDMIKLTRKK